MIVVVRAAGEDVQQQDLGLRSFPRNSVTMAFTPSAISGVLAPELFVPIITTASLGEIPSMLPCCNRHSTCCV